MQDKELTPETIIEDLLDQTTIEDLLETLNELISCFFVHTDLEPEIRVSIMSSYNIIRKHLINIGKLNPKYAPSYLMKRAG